MGGLLVTDANGEAVRAEVVAERAVDGGYEADLLLYTTVPACGYVVCYVEEMPQLALNLPKVDGETVIENEFYKIVVDPMVGGGIVSLFDKENNRELINANGDGPANRLVALKETHDRMETQHEFYTTGHKLLSDWEEASVQRTVGAEFATLTVCYDLGNVVHVDKVGSVALGSIGELTCEAGVALVALAVVGLRLSALATDHVIDAIDKAGHIAHGPFARGRRTHADVHHPHRIEALAVAYAYIAHRRA
jgi:hypothetical protein